MLYLFINVAVTVTIEPGSNTQTTALMLQSDSEVMKVLEENIIVRK